MVAFLSQKVRDDLVLMSDRENAARKAFNISEDSKKHFLVKRSLPAAFKGF